MGELDLFLLEPFNQLLPSSKYVLIDFYMLTLIQACLSYTKKPKMQHSAILFKDKTEFPEGRSHIYLSQNSFAKSIPFRLQILYEP
jgi:hypothetical protein